MTPIDLTKVASKFKSGWIAVDKKTHRILAHARGFSSVVRKVEQEKNVVLMPASADFSNIVPVANE